MPHCQRCKKFMFVRNNGYCKTCTNNIAAERKSEEHFRKKALYDEICSLFEELKGSTTYTGFDETKARIEHTLERFEAKTLMEFALIDSRYSPLNSWHSIWGSILPYEIDKDFSRLAKKHLEHISKDIVWIISKNTEESEVYSVAGVTFKNGRFSRQKILRMLKFGDSPYNKNDIDITIKEQEYENETAYGVFVEGDQVGYIPKICLAEFEEKWPRYLRVSDFEVHGGGRLPSGELLSYGIDIRVVFSK